jgi:hypothetical protein
MAGLMEHLGVTLSGEKIGEPGTIETVREHLSKLRAVDVIQTTSKIMMVLESVAGGDAKSTQVRLAKELFPADVQEELLALLSRSPAEGGVDVVFYPQQLLCMQKLAHAICEEGPPNSYDDHRLWTHFLIAAAQISDVINQFSNWPDFSSPLSDDERRSLAVFMLRNAETNRLAFYRAIAGRSFAMWIDRQLEWPDGLPTPEEFVKEEFGIDLGQFLAICLAPALMRANVTEAEPSEAPFDPAVYYRNTTLPYEVIAAVLATMTFPTNLTPEELNRPGTYWNHTDVSARPYFVASEALLIPGSITRAFERGTTGVFWMLHEKVRRDGDVQPLTNHFGRIFEDYGLRLIESVVSDGTIVQRETEYQWENNTLLSVDGLIATLGAKAPARVFVEFSTIRPAQAVLEVGDLETFEGYITRIVEKLRQLDRSIRHHQSGAFEIAGDFAGIDDAYLPVLVVDEPFFWSPWLRDLVAQQVTDLALFRVGAVAQPTICHIGEFENLCALVESGHNPADVLLDYVTSDREEPLKAHIHRRYEELREPALVTAGFDALFERLVESLGFKAE